MSFIEKFNTAKEAFHIQSFQEESMNEMNYTKAQEHLRSLGYKIKLETKTRFGVQIDLSKNYPESQLKRDLKDFKFEIEDNFIFIKP